VCSGFGELATLGGRFSGCETGGEINGDERLEAKATSKRQIDSIRRTQANNVAALNLIRDWLANGRFSLDDEVPDDLV
jgi:hypothetical protein